MKKYDDPSEDLENLFNEVLESTSIPHWVEIKIKSYDKQKDVCGIKKLDDLVSSLTPEKLNFAVVVNEKAFDQLTDEFKRIKLESVIAGVTVSDTDVVSLSKPDFVEYTGVLQKFGHEKIIAMRENIESIYTKIKEEEDAIKAQTKGKRGRKPKH